MRQLTSSARQFMAAARERLFSSTTGTAEKLLLVFLAVDLAVLLVFSTSALIERAASFAASELRAVHSAASPTPNAAAQTRAGSTSRPAALPKAGGRPSTSPKTTR